MAAFSASIDETCAFQLGNKFSHLLRHKITPEYLFVLDAAPYPIRLVRRVV